MNNWRVKRHIEYDTRPYLTSEDVKDTVEHVGLEHVTLKNIEDCDVTQLFANPTLRSLKLRHCRWRSPGFGKLCQYLRRNGNIESLNMNLDRMNWIGVNQFAKSIKRNTRLRTLTLCDSMDDICTEELTRKLRHNSTLTNLNVNFRTVSISGIMRIMNDISKNKTLRHLTLDDCRLAHFGSIVNSMVTNTTLASLAVTVGRRGLVDPVMDKKLFKLVARNSTLESLSIHNLHIRNFSQFTSVLEANTTLCSLTLANVQMNEERVKELLAVIDTKPEFHTLSLRFNECNWAIFNDQ